MVDLALSTPLIRLFMQMSHSIGEYKKRMQNGRRTAMIKSMSNGSKLDNKMTEIDAPI